MVADAMAKRALGLQQGVFERRRTPLQDLCNLLHQDALGYAMHGRMNM